MRKQQSVIGDRGCKILASCRKKEKWPFQALPTSPIEVAACVLQLFKEQSSRAGEHACHCHPQSQPCGRKLPLLDDHRDITKWGMHLTPEAPRSSIRALEDHSRTLGEFQERPQMRTASSALRLQVSNSTAAVPPRGAMSGGCRTHDRCPMAPRGCGRRSRRPQGVGSSGVKCIPRDITKSCG